MVEADEGGSARHQRPHPPSAKADGTFSREEREKEGGAAAYK
jgi:hypothetical protein